MERLSLMRSTIDGFIERLKSNQTQDPALLKRKEFINSYNIALLAHLLALKRGLNPELAVIAGHLHAIGRVVHGISDLSHSTLGALEAERALRKAGLFSESEIFSICSAIRSQFTVGTKGGPYEELLKDAILLGDYLGKVDYEIAGDNQTRLMHILTEFGMA